VNVRKAHHVLPLLVSLLFAGSCLDLSHGVAISEVRVANASGQTLTLFMDEELSVVGSKPPNVSLIGVAPGDHTLIARNVNTSDVLLPFGATPGGTENVVAFSSDDGTLNLVQLDTTTVPTGNIAKVRALNFSRLIGNVDIYASQAGGAGAKLATAFPVLAKTPYVEGAPGPWEVYLTTAGTTNKLLTTTFTTLPGDRWTVLVIDDSLSRPVLRVLPN
jgi:hypothetical protein